MSATTTALYPTYSLAPGLNIPGSQLASCTNLTSLTLIEPSYLFTAPGRACVISTNFTSSTNSTSSSTSILQSCCGVNAPISSYTSLGDAGACGYAYCNITDQNAQNGFMACLNSSAPSVQGKCFTSYQQDTGAPTPTPTKSGAEKLGAGMGSWVLMGMVVSLVVGVNGLGL